MGKIADRQCTIKVVMYVPQIILNNVVGFHHSHDDLLHLIVCADTQTHKEHIEGYRQRDDNCGISKASLLFALIDRYYNERNVNENRMRYTLTFDKFTTIEIKTTVALLLSLQFRRICARFSTFFSSSIVSLFFILNIYWWRVCRGNGKCVEVPPEVVVGVVGLSRRIYTQIINAKIANHSNANI